MQLFCASAQARPQFQKSLCWAYTAIVRNFSLQRMKITEPPSGLTAWRMKAECAKHPHRFKSNKYFKGFATQWWNSSGHIENSKNPHQGALNLLTKDQYLRSAELSSYWLLEKWWIVVLSRHRSSFLFALHAYCHFGLQDHRKKSVKKLVY